MKICVCYVCVTNGPITDGLSARFVSTYHEFPPDMEHDTVVICQGGPPKTENSVLFTAMRAHLWPRPNDPGWDISAYISASRGICADYDMMLCLGESNYFHRAGWLKRLVEAAEKHGPGMYGPYSSNAVRGHLNTTAFMCPPKLLAQYPIRVTNRAERYGFEHGERAMWRRLAARNIPVRMVTWDGEWKPREWRTPANILWRGDQSNLLMWCNHSDGYFNAPELTRRSWEASTDRAFK